VSTIGIADDMVRASVRALMAGRRHNYATLAEAVGMSDETLRRKLKATGPRSAFTAGELAVLADYFGRTLDDLVTGLGGMVTLPVTGATPPGLDSELTVTYPQDGASGAAQIYETAVSSTAA
jgi:hypothetical protein